MSDRTLYQRRSHPYLHTAKPNLRDRSRTTGEPALGVLAPDMGLLQPRSFEATRQLLTQEQAIGQYVLYRLLLEQVDPERELYLAVADITFDGRTYAQSVNLPR